MLNENKVLEAEHHAVASEVSEVVYEMNFCRFLACVAPLIPLPPAEVLLPLSWRNSSHRCEGCSANFVTRRGESEMQLETSRAQVRELRKLLQSDELSTFAASRLLDRFRGLAPAVSSLALALEDLWTQLWRRGYMGSRCGLKLGHLC